MLCTTNVAAAEVAARSRGSFSWRTTPEGAFTAATANGSTRTPPPGKIEYAAVISSNDASNAPSANAGTRGSGSSRMPSRAEGGTPLKGTKRGVVGSRRVFIGIGNKDGRTLVILPLLDARLHCTAIALLHVEFRADLPVEGKTALLGHRRLEEIVNGVSEADVPWTDALLAPVPPKHLACFTTEKIVEEIVARAKRA